MNRNTEIALVDEMGVTVSNGIEIDDPRKTAWVYLSLDTDLIRMGTEHPCVPLSSAEARELAAALIDHANVVDLAQKVQS